MYAYMIDTNQSHLLQTFYTYTPLKYISAQSRLPPCRQESPYTSRNNLVGKIMIHVELRLIRTASTVEFPLALRPRIPESDFR